MNDNVQHENLYTIIFDHDILTSLKFLDNNVSLYGKIQRTFNVLTCIVMNVGVK